MPKCPRAHVLLRPSACRQEQEGRCNVATVRPLLPSMPLRPDQASVRPPPPPLITLWSVLLFSFILFPSLGRSACNLAALRRANAARIGARVLHARCRLGNHKMNRLSPKGHTQLRTHDGVFRYLLPIVSSRVSCYTFLTARSGPLDDGFNPTGSEAARWCLYQRLFLFWQVDRAEDNDRTLVGSMLCS
jgi:hypothetical protein